MLITRAAHFSAATSDAVCVGETCVWSEADTRLLVFSNLATGSLCYVKTNAPRLYIYVWTIYAVMISVAGKARRAHIRAECRWGWWAFIRLRGYIKMARIFSTGADFEFRVFYRDFWNNFRVVLRCGERFFWNWSIYCSIVYACLIKNTYDSDVQAKVVPLVGLILKLYM